MKKEQGVNSQLFGNKISNPDTTGIYTSCKGSDIINNKINVIKKYLFLLD